VIRSEERPTLGTGDLPAAKKAFPERRESYFSKNSLPAAPGSYFLKKHPSFWILSLPSTPGDYFLKKYSPRLVGNLIFEKIVSRHRRESYF
jgi:hypothetical protein